MNGIKNFMFGASVMLNVTLFGVLTLVLYAEMQQDTKRKKEAPKNYSSYSEWYRDKHGKSLNEEEA